MIRRIYIGPSLQGLSANTIFRGDLPLYIEDLIEKRPAVAGLIVPLENLQKARSEMNEKGNILNTYLETIKKGK